MDSAVKKTTRSTLAVCCATAAVAIIALVLFFFDPARAPFYPVCLFHKMTGLLCPGCGSLRAMHHLLHGEWALAFRCNPLLIASGLVALALAARWVVQKRLGQTPATVWHPMLPWWFVAVIIVFGVLRNLPFAIFAWMSP